jgi:hypothetical protein
MGYLSNIHRKFNNLKICLEYLEILIDLDELHFGESASGMNAGLLDQIVRISFSSKENLK